MYLYSLVPCCFLVICKCSLVYQARTRGKDNFPSRMGEIGICEPDGCRAALMLAIGSSMYLLRSKVLLYRNAYCFKHGRCSFVQAGVND